MERLEAAFHGTRAQSRPCAHWSGNALQVLWPEVLQLKQSADKFSCAFSDDDCVWFSDSLQARGEVWRLANNRLLLGRTRPDQVADDNEPGRYAKEGLQRSVCLDRRYRCDQLQSGAHRSLGIILVGLGIAKINKHAVAKILRHESAEAAHGLSYAFLIGRDDLAQILGVHARRELR